MGFSQERALPIKEAAFKHIFENAAIGMALVCPEGNFLNLNSLFCQMIGYERDYLIGRNFQEITYRDDFDIGSEFFKKALLGKNTGITHLEKRYVRANGEIFWARVTTYLAREDDGKPLYFVTQIADITETKTLVNQLREKAWQLNKAQEMSKVGHWRLDAATMEVIGSDELYRIFGVGKDEASLDAFAAAVHPDDREYDLAHIRRGLEQGESWDIEHRLLDRDGKVKYVRAAGEATLKEDGLVECLFGTVQDITERKEAEQAVRESDIRMRTLLNNSPAEISLRDKSGRYVIVNEHFERQFGVTESEILGKTDFELLPRDAAIACEAHDREVLTTGKAISKEDELNIRGDLRTFMTIKYPVLDVDGDLMGIGLIATDITEQRRAEEALRESSLRFQQLAENIGAVFWMTNPDKNRMIYVSPAYEEIWGRTCESLYESPRDFINAIHPDDRSAVIAELPEQQQGSYDATYRIIRPDGSHRWIQDQAFPVRDDSGQVYRIAGIAEDITEMVEREEQLRQAQKMEAVGQLTGGVAHDFNNLLATILGHAEIAEDLLGESDESVTAIIRAAERGAELTQRLLSFSRRQSLKSRPINLGDLIADVHQLLRRTLGETIDIEIATAPRLWNAVADPGQLENALLNLAINARDAMPEGGKLTVETANVSLSPSDVTSRIEVAPGDYVSLSVRDSGIGMPPDVTERAFEPFFTTKDVGEGSGLGLSMVYGFAKQSGGDVTIESDPGHGTTVTLFLPRAKDSIERPTSDDMSSVPRGRGETVLVIEDDPDVCAMTAAMLDKLGYRVLSAENARVGLDILEAEPAIDLMLSDVVLPGGMSGPDLADRARAFNSEIKVLFMSGHAEQSVHLRTPLSEGSDLLDKPFRTVQLAQQVRAVLDR